MNAHDQMNNELYRASLHLVEAGKLVAKTSEPVGFIIMQLADKILSIIDAPEPKLNKEQIDSILEEILNSKE